MAIFIPTTEEDKAFHQKMLLINTRQRLFEHYINPIKEQKIAKVFRASLKTSTAKGIIYYHVLDPCNLVHYPIIDMTEQEVYDVAIELYCEAISMGDKRAKVKLAEELLKNNNPYLTYDKQLGKFLMQVGLLEKQLGSCIYFSEHWETEPNDNIINFWGNLFNVWCEKIDKDFERQKHPTLGIKLDFKYDKENKKVIFTCPNLGELREIEREKKIARDIFGIYQTA